MPAASLRDCSLFESRYTPPVFGETICVILPPNRMCCITSPKCPASYSRCVRTCVEKTSSLAARDETK
eukprot:3937067-Rhodomonas_salina.1